MASTTITKWAGLNYPSLQNLNCILFTFTVNITTNNSGVSTSTCSLKSEDQGNGGFTDHSCWWDVTLTDAKGNSHTLASLSYANRKQFSCSYNNNVPVAKYFTDTTATFNRSSSASETVTIKVDFHMVHSSWSILNDNLTMSTTLTLESYASTVKGPTSFTYSGNSIITPNASVKLQWSGASSGTSNSIKKYVLYARADGNPTASNYSYRWDNATSGSTFSITNATRGKRYYFGVETVNTNTSFSNPFVYGPSAVINSLPNPPTVTYNSSSLSNNAKIVISSETTTATVNLSAGSDSNSTQTRTVIKDTSTQNLGTQFTFSIGSAGSSESHTFYTYDGLEKSGSGITITVARNQTLSDVSISFNSGRYFVINTNNSGRSTSTLSSLKVSIKKISGEDKTTKIKTFSYPSLNTNYTVDIFDLFGIKNSTWGSSYKITTTLTDSLNEVKETLWSSTYQTYKFATIVDVMGKSSGATYSNDSSKYNLFNKALWFKTENCLKNSGGIGSNNDLEYILRITNNNVNYDKTLIISEGDSDIPTTRSINIESLSGLYNTFGVCTVSLITRYKTSSSVNAISTYGTSTTPPVYKVYNFRFNNFKTTSSQVYDLSSSAATFQLTCSIDLYTPSYIVPPPGGSTFTITIFRKNTLSTPSETMTLNHTFSMSDSTLTWTIDKSNMYSSYSEKEGFSNNPLSLVLDNYYSDIYVKLSAINLLGDELESGDIKFYDYSMFRPLAFPDEDDNFGIYINGTQKLNETGEMSVTSNEPVVFKRPLINNYGLKDTNIHYDIYQRTATIPSNLTSATYSLFYTFTSSQVNNEDNETIIHMPTIQNPRYAQYKIRLYHIKNPSVIAEKEYPGHLGLDQGIEANFRIDKTSETDRDTGYQLNYTIFHAGGVAANQLKNGLEQNNADTASSFDQISLIFAISPDENANLRGAIENLVSGAEISDASIDVIEQTIYSRFEEEEGIVANMPQISKNTGISGQVTFGTKQPINTIMYATAALCTKVKLTDGSYLRVATTYLDSYTFYKQNTPTVALREHQIGINTANLEEDAIIQVYATTGKDKIILANSEGGIYICGAIIDGGTW